MATKEFELGFALIPRKPAVAEIHEYVKGLCAKYPQAEVLIFKGRNLDEDYSVLYKNPQVSLHTTHRRLDIVAAGYCALASARAMELDWLFVNTGIRRYSLDEFIGFVDKCQPHLSSTHLLFGVPPILRPASIKPEETAALEKKPVRYRLLVDFAINYIYCSILGRGFTNINAGIFGVSRAAIKYLLNVGHYDDSSLLCSQLYWHLKHAGGNFVVKAVNTDNIHIDDLGFNRDKAVQELATVIWMIMKIGRPIKIRAAINDFFAEKEKWDRWFCEEDRKWFMEEIVPRAEKALATKK